MKRTAQILVVICLSLATWEGGYARDAARAPSDGPTVPFCHDSRLNLRGTEPGFKCRTSKGVVYERVSIAKFGEAWKGPTSLIWSDYLGELEQKEAVHICQKLGGFLPTRGDFQQAEASGFREVLPYMNDRWYWSSTAYRTLNGEIYGQAFCGLSGLSEGIDPYTEYPVRCVKRVRTG